MAPAVLGVHVATVFNCLASTVVQWLKEQRAANLAKQHLEEGKGKMEKIQSRMVRELEKKFR